MKRRASRKKNRTDFIHAIPACAIIPLIALAGTRVMNRMRVEGDGAGSARGGGVLGDEP
jgi:hypothetical protein